MSLLNKIKRIKHEAGGRPLYAADVLLQNGIYQVLDKFFAIPYRKKDNTNEGFVISGLELTPVEGTNEAGNPLVNVFDIEEGLVVIDQQICVFNGETNVDLDDFQFLIKDKTTELDAYANGEIMPVRETIIAKLTNEEPQDKGYVKIRHDYLRTWERALTEKLNITDNPESENLTEEEKSITIASAKALNNHSFNKGNPHSVTAEQTTFDDGNVDYEANSTQNAIEKEAEKRNEITNQLSTDSSIPLWDDENKRFKDGNIIQEDNGDVRIDGDNFRYGDKKKYTGAFFSSTEFMVAARVTINKGNDGSFKAKIYNNNTIFGNSRNLWGEAVVLCPSNRDQGKGPRWQAEWYATNSTAKIQVVEIATNIYEVQVKTYEHSGSWHFIELEFFRGRFPSSVEFNQGAATNTTPIASQYHKYYNGRVISNKVVQGTSGGSPNIHTIINHGLNSTNVLVLCSSQRTAVGDVTTINYKIVDANKILFELGGGNTSTFRNFSYRIERLN